MMVGGQPVVERRQHRAAKLPDQGCALGLALDAMAEIAHEVRPARLDHRQNRSERQQEPLPLTAGELRRVFIPKFAEIAKRAQFVEVSVTAVKRLEKLEDLAHIKSVGE